MWDSSGTSTNNNINNVQVISQVWVDIHITTILPTYNVITLIKKGYTNIYNHHFISSKVPKFRS